jgi:8-oxo-dGTP diphosphatase
VRDVTSGRVAAGAVATSPEDPRAGTYGGPVRRVPCVGAVVLDGDGRLLLVRRANPPGAGLWSVPGGRVESGEDDATALAREVAEETGLGVVVGELLGTVERDGPGGVSYVIADFRCTVTGGKLRAGDDATAVAWVSLDELPAVPTVAGLVDALEAWGVVPVRRSRT